MNTVVKHEGVAAPSTFTDEQIQLIKNSFCKGLSDNEFKIFLYTCQRTGLDPFAKQIYAVKRGDQMTIQTGIDGYRLIADRTGTYAPGPEVSFSYDVNGKLISATAHVKKLTRDGTWHIVPATAYFEEYCQTTKDGRAMGLWGKMPRTMLAKCAEALALRKANPADLSGIYTKEEMEQADIVEIQTPVKESVPVEYISSAEVDHLNEIISQCDPQKIEKIWAFLSKKCDGKGLSFLKKECYPKIESLLMDRRNEFQNSLKIETISEEDDDQIT